MRCAAPAAQSAARAGVRSRPRPGQTKSKDGKDGKEKASSGNVECTTLPSHQAKILGDKLPYVIVTDWASRSRDVHPRRSESDSETGVNRAIMWLSELISRKLPTTLASCEGAAVMGCPDHLAILSETRVRRKEASQDFVADETTANHFTK
ncbi:hypothetical protein An15g02940 [Aspergillus niger]|uniref:Uncharacterized protein n=2 Tax=Aspergillus niger TaxID=5061 RepID=A2R574_ASPNC|nr:hypothetical protein An15g02940 [Aspergillus niger]CAK42369.1 hypothetical protein An15g02940 [Aspergillus niger]